MGYSFWVPQNGGKFVTEDVLACLQELLAMELVIRNTKLF